MRGIPNPSCICLQVLTELKKRRGEVRLVTRAPKASSVYLAQVRTTPSLPGVRVSRVGPPCIHLCVFACVRGGVVCR